MIPQQVVATQTLTQILAQDIVYGASRVTLHNSTQLFGSPIEVLARFSQPAEFYRRDILALLVLWKPNGFSTMYYANISASEPSGYKSMSTITLDTIGRWTGTLYLYYTDSEFGNILQSEVSVSFDVAGAISPSIETSVQITQGSDLNYMLKNFPPNVNVWVYVVGGGGLYTRVNENGYGVGSFTPSEPPGNYTLAADDNLGHTASATFSILPGSVAGECIITSIKIQTRDGNGPIYDVMPELGSPVAPTIPLNSQFWPIVRVQNNTTEALAIRVNWYVKDPSGAHVEPPKGDWTDESGVVPANGGSATVQPGNMLTVSKIGTYTAQVTVITNRSTKTYDITLLNAPKPEGSIYVPTLTIQTGTPQYVGNIDVPLGEATHVEVQVTNPNAYEVKYALRLTVTNPQNVNLTPAIKEVTLPGGSSTNAVFPRMVFDTPGRYTILLQLYSVEDLITPIAQYPYSGYPTNICNDIPATILREHINIVSVRSFIKERDTAVRPQSIYRGEHPSVEITWMNNSPTAQQPEFQLQYQIGSGLWGTVSGWKDDGTWTKASLVPAGGQGTVIVYGLAIGESADLGWDVGLQLVIKGIQGYMWQNAGSVFTVGTPADVVEIVGTPVFSVVGKQPGEQYEFGDTVKAIVTWKNKSSKVLGPKLRLVSVQSWHLPILGDGHNDTPGPIVTCPSINPGETGTVELTAGSKEGDLLGVYSIDAKIQFIDVDTSSIDIATFTSVVSLADSLLEENIVIDPDQGVVVSIKERPNYAGDRIYRGEHVHAVVTWTNNHATDQIARFRLKVRCGTGLFGNWLTQTAQFVTSAAPKGGTVTVSLDSDAIPMDTPTDNGVDLAIEVETIGVVWGADNIPNNHNHNVYKIGTPATGFEIDGTPMFTIHGEDVAHSFENGDTIDVSYTLRNTAVAAMTPTLKLRVDVHYEYLPLINKTQSVRSDSYTPPSIPAGGTKDISMSVIAPRVSGVVKAVDVAILYIDLNDDETVIKLYPNAVPVAGVPGNAPIIIDGTPTFSIVGKAATDEFAAGDVVRAVVKFKNTTTQDLDAPVRFDIRGEYTVSAMLGMVAMPVWGKVEIGSLIQTGTIAPGGVKSVTLDHTVALGNTDIGSGTATGYLTSLTAIFNYLSDISDPNSNTEIASPYTNIVPVPAMPNSLLQIGTLINLVVVMLMMSLMMSLMSGDMLGGLLGDGGSSAKPLAPSGGPKPSAPQQATSAIVVGQPYQQPYMYQTPYYPQPYMYQMPPWQQPLQLPPGSEEV